MAKLAAARCAHSRVQTANYSQESLLNADGLSHRKRKLAMVSAPARSFLATPPRKLYASIFFSEFFLLNVAAVVKQRSRATSALQSNVV